MLPAAVNSKVSDTESKPYNNPKVPILKVKVLMELVQHPMPVEPISLSEDMVSTQIHKTTGLFSKLLSTVITLRFLPLS